MSTISFNPRLTANHAAPIEHAISVRVPRGVKNQLCVKLAERFSRMHAKTGRSLRSVSIECGLSNTVAAGVSRGANIPALRTLERLAVALGVSPGWLAYGYEGEEPFRERNPRPLIPQSDPIPDDRFRVFRDLSTGFATRLRQARERSGLSMRTLSSAAGVSAQSWSICEAGRVDPGVDTAERMAVALGVSPSWLAFGDEPN